VKILRLLIYCRMPLLLLIYALIPLPLTPLFPPQGVDIEASTLWIDCAMPVRRARLQLLPIVEELAPCVILRQTEGIASAVVLPPPKGSDTSVVQTAGVNFAALAANSEIARVVDLRKVSALLTLYTRGFLAAHTHTHTYIYIYTYI